MKKLIATMVLAASLSGCGSNGGAVGGDREGFNFSSTQGNFITTTVEVENRFFYILNRTDNNVSGLYAVTEEEGHDHAHGRIMTQEDDHDDDHEGEGEEHEDEGLELESLDGSPYLFGAANLVDLGVESSGRYFFILDSSGNLSSYEIDGIRGFLNLKSTVPTGVANPRRIAVSPDGRGVGVLGDSVSIHGVTADGLLNASGSTQANTQGWVDLDLNGVNGVATTSTGAVGFQWIPGSQLFPQFNVTLPGGSRGEAIYVGDHIYVVNQGAASVSQLTQSGNSEITLEQTFALPAELTAPVQIESIEDGEELVVADADSLSRLVIEPNELHEEVTVPISRVPNRLFAVPESEVLLVGHSTGEGTTQIILHEGELEIMDEPGPGGHGAFGFGFAERSGTVTQTVNL